MAVFVISKYGGRLMPTTRYGKVRHMLKDGLATICKRNPFTIQLTYEASRYVQPIELCMDTGYEHIGLSLKSDAKEYVSEQRDLLSNEKSRHDDRRRYRRTRRSRLRYRKPRFNNRRASKKPGWIAPSLRNKAERHVDLVAQYASVCPVQRIVLEVGSFDTMLLKAMEEGKPIPQGVDYQHGPAYLAATRRAAVFQRDGYKCVFCGRSIKDGAIFHEHHAYFWRGQHGNSIDELVTCCEKCHTSKNHQPGGKLWGFDKKLKRYNGAAFMNTVRWYIVNRIKETCSDIDVKATYGAFTKAVRDELGLDKTHCNDAYVMGDFHPAVRAVERHYKKRRRNNRVLEKFYDAKYFDVRDGMVKSGAELGCQRNNRREPRMSEKNLRQYHGEKKTKGRRSIRSKRYSIRPNDILLYKDKLYCAVGVFSNGTQVSFGAKKYAPIKKVNTISHCDGWAIDKKQKKGNSSQP